MYWKPAGTGVLQLVHRATPTGTCHEHEGHPPVGTAICEEKGEFNEVCSTTPSSEVGFWIGAVRGEPTTTLDETRAPTIEE